ncbi:MAG: phage N-6-adenine-methyltransferase [Muribaculaceae bacterium]|nr:phage N-6-adenine-methyltransferase [Muribaculaceae bacterium]
MTAGRHINTKSKSWCTPPKYVEAVERVLNTIYLDPCSNEESIVNAHINYMLPEQDGLKESWAFPTIYVNPPYGIDKQRGTSIKNWLAKCSMAHNEYDSEVLALVPVATNTRHWKEYVFKTARAICFLYDTRLKFIIDGSLDNKGAPMACAMIYWGHNLSKFVEVFREFGACIDLQSLTTPQEQPTLFDTF